MKIRQDAWSHEDDLLLAETVLHHIRDGSTQVAAFDEVADKLNRTSAACGYRWNAEVRDQYVQAVELAKKQRKEKKRLAEKNHSKQEQMLHSKLKDREEQKTRNEKAEQKLVISTNQRTSQSLTIDDCIAFLQHFQTETLPSLEDENKQLQMENQLLKQKNQELQLKYEKSMKNSKKLENDYKLLMNILNQARNMAELSEEPYQTIH